MRGKAREERTEKADADDRDGLARLDTRTPEYVVCAAKRFAGYCDAIERGRQRYHRIYIRHIVFSMRSVSQRCDALADLEPVDAFAYVLDPPPAFVPGRACRLRIVEPRSPLPQ